MRYDLDRLLHTPEGKPFLNQDGSQPDPPWSIKVAAYGAVTTPLRGDDNLGLDQKLKLYDLALRLHKGGIVDLTAEEISTIKERASRAFTSILLIGDLVCLLEGDAAVGKLKSA